MKRRCAFWSLVIAVAQTGCSESDESSSNGPNGSSGKGGASAGSSGSTAKGGSNTGGTTGSSGAGSGEGGEPASAGTDSGGAPPTGGSSGSSGSGGSGGTMPGLEDCPAPPAGSSDASVLALNAVNTLRLAMGVPCMELVPEISVAAQNHCDYYTQYPDDDPCIANAHAEVESCNGFTGTSAGARMEAAGYDGNGWSEVMAFQNDPEDAVAQFINSVWHRTPLVSPWYRHMGYGGADNCDTIDLSGGPDTPDDVTAVYPYANQTDVPQDFNGAQEGPMPPEPPTGWPSGSPIHIYVRDVESVVSHRIDVDGTDAPLDHEWIDDGSQFIFYTYAPFEPATTYRVRVSFMRGGAPLDFDWTFTTEN
jgi:uncharacterized protein YkwD